MTMSAQHAQDPLRVFISYDSSQSEFVSNHLVPRLQREGHDPWWAGGKICPSEDWEEEIRTALRNSDRVVLVVSKATERSNHVRDEVHAAFEWNKVVLPVLREECDPRMIHLRLGRIQWINGSDEDRACDDVADSL